MINKKIYYLPMKYEEAIEYLEQLNKRGIHPGLEGIANLCEKMDHPEKGSGFIHVVGTNGKGSTSLFISEMLKAQGYKVGLYSSPAVFSPTEIIKVNGRSISKKSFANLVERASEINDGSYTRFEIETLMALLHFREEECDYAVIEAGMGGLLDSTNIIESPLACVFTSIGMDHVDYLGNTLELIARNKAGIVKKNALVISTTQNDEVIDVLREKSSLENCHMEISDYREAGGIRFLLGKTVFNYKGMKGLEIGLLGTFQIQNAALAIDVAIALGVKEKAIRKGLFNAKEGGRFEKISDTPRIFLDGAHNEPASLELANTIETYFTNKNIIYIMGMLKDKDVETVVRNTASFADCIFTVSTPNKVRTLSSFELAEVVKQYNPMVSSMDSMEEAVEMAMMMAKKDTVILIFGSLSHLAIAKQVVASFDKTKTDTHGACR